MPLTVTEQAAATLKELLDNQNAQPEQVLRLVSDGDGNHGFQLDVPKEGDQVVEHDGEPVMSIEPTISEELTGSILGIKDTVEGPSLAIYR